MTIVFEVNYQVLLGSDVVGITTLNVAEEINQTTRFNFTIPNTSQNRTILTDNIGNTVTIKKDKVIIHTGRIDVDNIAYTKTDIQVSGYAAYIELHFDFFSKDQGQYDIRRVQFDNVAANTVLGYVLSGTGFTVSECPSTNISLRGEYESYLEWISAIARAIKWTDASSNKHSSDWWIVGTEVHIANERGSAKGEIDGLVSMTNDKDYLAIENTVYGFGMGDGINQLITNKTNAGSVGTYGTRAILRTDRRFRFQSTLDDDMQEHADEHSEPLQNVSCTLSTYDWYDNDLSVGDTITLEDIDLDISGSYRVLKADIGLNTAVLEIVNIVPMLTSTFKAIAKNLKVDGRYMQGATNIWQTSHGKNVSNAVPLTLKIFIPSEAVYINAVKLSYAVLPFEKYTGVTSGGSSHSHTISVYDPFDTSDIGKLGVQTYSGQNYIVSSANLSAIQANSADTAHTHDVDANLSTVAADCNDIAISVDSVDKTAALEAIYGTLSTSEDSDLEIKDYFSSPAAGNWHSVVITPNGVGSPAGMCYIMAHLSMQVFIRSE